MAIYVHCPSCNERLDEIRQDCAHCGADLPPGVLYAMSAAAGQTPASAPMAMTAPAHFTPSSPPPASMPEEPPPPQNSALRPWLAAALSLLCGLGQLYNGQVAKGMVLIVLGTASLLSVHLLIGKILLPIVWLYAIIDAYRVARRTSTPDPS